MGQDPPVGRPHDGVLLEEAFADQPAANPGQAEFLGVPLGQRRQAAAEVDGQVDRRRRVGRRQPEERDRDEGVGEEGQRERVDRARFSQAEPAASFQRLIGALEGDAAEAALEGDQASERGPVR